ncbi:MAG: hypothetical protein ACFFCM_23030 [Promethearchaeota archaeon]
MSVKKEKIKLSKWLETNLPHYFPEKGDLISLIETIVEATIPIRGLLEKGLTSREIQYRMSIEAPLEGTINVYDEEQIHEDVLTHSIILKAIQDGDTDFTFIASEEADPVISNGKFGITIDPVDGSSNVAVNRTVGTIVGIYNIEGKIICSFYVLYGIFTNLVLAVNGVVAEFYLDTVPYSMTFYHYIFRNFLTLPDPEQGGIRCLGGDSTQWSDQCKAYEQILIQNHVKDRYSGSFVGDFHAILFYGGVYSYFSSPKPKIRLYYEWLPLAFIAKTLGGEFLVIEVQNKTKKMDDIEPLTKTNIKNIHTTTCGGLIGSKRAVDWFLDIGK